MSHKLRLLLTLFSATALLGCPGDATDGQAPLRILNSTAECLSLAAKFPSGLSKLPGNDREAVAIQFDPPALFRVNLETEPPTSAFIPPPLPEVLSTCSSGVDSDSDGIADSDRSVALGIPFCRRPQPGTVRPLDATRAAVTTSDIEQVLFLDPRDGSLRHVQLDAPPAGPDFDPNDWFFWPLAGMRPFRTAISTITCVDGPGFVDSLGDPILAPLRCDPLVNGFRTNLTSDVAAIGSRLFVTTSNLIQAPRYAPGTVLVFDYDTSVDPPRIGPDAANAVILTTAFNATSLTPYQTPAGRDLLLVGLTGAIEGDGSAAVTDAAIDVIDADTLTLIATIPLGRAGLGFSGLAIDSSKRLALGGSALRRVLFGIDLAALDDPTLGLGPQTLPILLDGMTPGFADARVFSDANPFALPKRPDGPLDTVCFSQTSVDIKDDGSFALASDRCDGTMTRLTLNLPATRTDPIDPGTVLTIDRRIDVAAPLLPSSTGETRDIDRVLIRDGTPVVDFVGPDVYYLAGEENASVCGVRIDAL